MPDQQSTIPASDAFVLAALTALSTRRRRVYPPSIQRHLNASLPWWGRWTCRAVISALERLEAAGLAVNRGIPRLGDEA